MTPTRPALPREFVAVHKRRRMMDAMAELSAERGYGATKIADVVARAGVARKTLYDNFAGKEELFLAAFETAAREAREAVEAACEAAGEGDDAVEAGLAALLEFLAENPAQARMCMIEALSASPATAARYEQEIHEFVLLLRGAVPAAPGRPATLEETVVGGVAWILQQRVRGGEVEALGALLPELSSFVLSPYRGVGKPGGGR